MGRVIAQEETVDMSAHRNLGRAPVAPARHPDDDRPSTFERIEQAARIVAESPGQAGGTRGGLEAVAAIFLAWRERRFAAVICRELLRRHAETVRRNPGLLGLPLYRRIVADRHGGSLPLADAILDRASQSFAQWPSCRTVNYRDVVHYLVVLEFIAANKGARWIHADLKQFIGDAIPRCL